FEPDRPETETVEEADAVAQKHGNEVDLELVEQPGFQVLLSDSRPTGERDVLVAGGRPSLLEGGFDPVGHERERGPSLLGYPLARVMGENEHRDTERRVFSPPAVGSGIVFPRALSTAEHSSAHHDGPGRAERFLDDLAVGVGLTAREAMPLTPAREREGPFVQSIAALPQRPLDGLVRSRDEAVDRHRDVARQARHSLGPFEISLSS